MAVETLPPTPTLFDNQSKNPIFSNVRYVPNELKRRTLKNRIHAGEKISEQLWTIRGRAVEIYVADVIATQTETVKRVDVNTAWDQKGPDMRIIFTDGVPVESILVEVKSSSLELQNGKQKIRDEYFDEQIRNTLIRPRKQEEIANEMKKKQKEWNTKTDSEKESIISKRLTDLGIILINGGEKNHKEKTPEEILDDSFYIQLNRASQQLLRNQIPEDSGQLVLFPRLKST